MYASFTFGLGLTTHYKVLKQFFIKALVAFNYKMGLNDLTYFSSQS